MNTDKTITNLISDKFIDAKAGEELEIYATDGTLSGVDAKRYIRIVPKVGDVYGCWGNAGMCDLVKIIEIGHPKKVKSYTRELNEDRSESGFFKTGEFEGTITRIKVVVVK